MVTGIIVVISSIMLVNNNRFGGVIQLENLAYDVALSVRQAQVYGISVQRYGGDDFSSGYGMHFDLADVQHYELFADIDKDGFFDAENPPPDGENVSPSPYTIRSGFEISDLCTTALSGVENCEISKVDMVFKRPEADAYIRSDGNSALEKSARITLKSPRGDIMSVVVENSGQISVRRGATQ